MSEKKNTLGKAVAVAAGVGAAYLALKKKENEKQVLEQQAAQNSNYRNTERGKYDKNSKGIYYTNGNYEAFARPEKPEGVDEKHAYIVGSGLAALSAGLILMYVMVRAWITYSYFGGLWILPVVHVWYL